VDGPIKEAKETEWIVVPALFSSTMNAPTTIDEWLMRLFYLVEVAGCIASIVYMIQLTDEVRTHPGLSATLQKRFKYIETTVVVASAANLVMGIVMGFYFATMSKDLSKHFNPARRQRREPCKETCEHRRLNESPRAMKSMITSLMITLVGAAFLGIFYAGGISYTLTWCIDDAYEALGESTNAGAMRKSLRALHVNLIVSQIATALGIVVTLYIGHAWAVLRTKCLQATLKHHEATETREGATLVCA
jgi:hypothetical protein